MSKRVLIIEDEIDIREALAEVIAEAGYEVRTAENGETGLATALEYFPDLIMLDINMPVMDGQEMLTRLRQDTWGRDAKVMMLTAMDDPRSIVTAHAGNIVDYVIKAQHSLDEIIEKVLVALSKN